MEIEGIEMKDVEHEIEPFVDGVLICVKQPNSCLPKLEKQNFIHVITGQVVNSM